MIFNDMFNMDCVTIYPAEIPELNKVQCKIIPNEGLDPCYGRLQTTPILHNAVDKLI